MKSSLLVLFILIGFTNLSAQDSIVTIKTGSRISDVLSTTDIFLYPRFISGTVFFKNGTKANARMNYSNLYDQVLFIGPKRDTLALDDEKTIKYIAVEKDTFYYNEGFVRLVSNNKVIKLAMKKNWEAADVRKIGAFNSSTNAHAIDSYIDVSDGIGKRHDLILNEDMVLRRRVYYYFGDEYNNFHHVGKKNLMLLFPKKQKIISQYLKDNKINFDDKADLDKVVEFISDNL